MFLHRGFFLSLNPHVCIISLILIYPRCFHIGGFLLHSIFTIIRVVLLYFQ